MNDFVRENQLEEKKQNTCIYLRLYMSPMMERPANTLRKNQERIYKTIPAALPLQL